jgi:hypothetical protein
MRGSNPRKRALRTLLATRLSWKSLVYSSPRCRSRPTVSPRENPGGKNTSGRKKKKRKKETKNEQLAKAWKVAPAI